MKWKIENNTISTLDFHGKNIILPWGIETADTSSFFSLEDGIGWRYQEISRALSVNDTRATTQIKVKMREGLWELRLDDRIINDTTIIREATLLCLEDTHLMDFVMRFRFSNDHFNQATISNTKFIHRNTNIYYQYPVDHVSLDGPNITATVKIIDFKAPESLTPHMYVRDNIGEWVVHARMLPNRSNKNVIKLCNPWANTRPLPQFLSKVILAIPGLKNALWYRCERKPYTNRIMRRINPQACPIVKVKKGTKLSWKIEVNLCQK